MIYPHVPMQKAPTKRELIMACLVIFISGFCVGLLLFHAIDLTEQMREQNYNQGEIK